MDLKNKIDQIEQLQQTINNYGKLNDEVLKKITYKFRLEWNYHSNKIEGNSLDRLETRTVMVGNITIDGKPIKDVYEMHQHDEIITNILRIGKGELNISEKRIKDVHASLMHEEDPEKKIHIGKWKDEPNYIYNYKKERFDFVSPREVPERMHNLINWLNSEKEKIKRNDPKALHPSELAFEFHLQYVTIHPFYDGNGRTARIFTNLILISYGYPPLYVKEQERDIYNQYLADIQGYGGKPDLFYSFMADLLIRSQSIVIDAIEGKEIDEPDDLDKKLSLFERELEFADTENDIKLHFNRIVFYTIFDTWISSILKSVVPILQKFNRFFSKVDHHINVGSGVSTRTPFSDQKPEEIIQTVFADIKRAEHVLDESGVTVRISAEYENFKKTVGLQTFNVIYSIEIKLMPIKYEVYADQYNEKENKILRQILFENLLHKPLKEDEINIFSQKVGDTILKDIDIKTKKIGLRQ